MSLLPQPTVVTIIPSGPISQPPRPTATPNFRDGGELLAGDCASPSYTLINGGDLVLYAAVVGCNADRPQCCPWNVTADANPSNPGAGGAPGDNLIAAAPGQFPIPAADAKDSLESGYYKFTREIASQTPCFSSLVGKATPPPITIGLAANPTDMSLPTSAVVNLAWAMAYKVADPAPALSKGAVVGIGVGSGVVAIAILAAVVLLVVRWRRARAVKAEQPVGLGDSAQQGMTYQSGYHAPPGSPPPPMEGYEAPQQGGYYRA
ncbi:hypothetical protein C8A00DRAFT_46151 [Chaetomidium leptoderma]|uniref:Uncharacterized protein n=1 Tax=Chaetomidium leptoderma TaxID=669021 RepID=A0AAN6VG50_9PEZI|nr:hypothetical protein C8A00DRAFT_46151 [Chaetomidium leptoderma]